jgi:hypothetical protein
MGSASEKDPDTAAFASIQRHIARPENRHIGL